MPALDPQWWALRSIPLAAWTVGTAAAVVAAVMLRRWLERLEREREADEHRLHLEKTLSEAADPARRLPPVRPAARASLWVRLLPALGSVIGGLGILDTLDILELDEVVTSLQTAGTTELFPIGSVSITPARLLLVIATLALARWASNWAQRAAGRAIRNNGPAREGVVASVQRLVHYGVMTFFGVTALREIGVDLSTLFAAGAVFAVGIGFGLQSLTQNFISGLILLIERTIKPGDVLLVDGRMVKISELGIRATIGRTPDDDELILPNGKLLEGFLVNYSLHSEVVRARATVGVSYEADVDEVMRVLQQAAVDFPNRVRPREPAVLLTEFGSSALEFEVSIWIDAPFQRQAIVSDLRVAIWRALRDHQIPIPFPQLDVHVVRRPAEAAEE